ncbi:MAG: DJ-1/PfpI family protein [Lachnospiraceae bacterium]|nr:DJ-1/PfpI family protein [Lachnospiraceae bacterium]
MTEVYIFLADGFEEIEGLTVVDLLRRAGVPIQMVSISESRKVKGSHGIEITADLLFDEIDANAAQMFVLPGGMPGTTHLAEHAGLAELLKEQAAAGKKIAAICAAPTVLGGLGLLKGHQAVCYPGLEDALTGAHTTENPVEICGNITTSRGMGTAIPFGLALVAQLRSQEAADQLAKSIVFPAGNK